MPFVSIHFKLFLPILVTISILTSYSFIGNFSKEAADNPAMDEDYLSAVRTSSDAVVKIPFNNQDIIPFITSVSDTFLLAANPGPANNGGSANWAMFLDLIAPSTRSVHVIKMRTASTATASSSFNVEVLVRVGTALGGPVSSGPGSSMAGWTSLGIVPAVQGPTSSGISEVFYIPTIHVPAGDTVGVALRFTGAGPRYVGTGSPPLSVYSDTNVVLITGEGRSAPFTPTGSWFSSRAMAGEIHYYVSNPSNISIVGSEIPNDFTLSQNYPNPFNPNTTIEFAVPVKGHLSLRIFNLNGQEVATLTDKEFNPGTYSINWNAADLSSGVYFYTIKADGFFQTKKMLLLK